MVLTTACSDARDVYNRTMYCVFGKFYIPAYVAMDLTTLSSKLHVKIAADCNQKSLHGSTSESRCTGAAIYA